MSGPKCYGYQVDPAVIERQRREAVLAASAARLDREITELRRAHAAARAELGKRAIGALGRLPKPGATERDHAALSEWLAAVRAKLEDELQRGREVAFLAALGSAGDAEAAVGGPEDTTASIRRVRQRTASAGQADDIRASVARALGRMRADVASEDRDRVVEYAEAIVRDADSELASARLDVLRARVGSVNGALQRRAERRDVVDAALERLAGVNGDQARAVRSKLNAAADGEGPLPAELDAAVADIADRHLRETQKRIVAETLTDAFTELGYEVGDDFATALTTAGFADVSNSKWGGYQLRVREHAQTGQLRFNVVRGPGLEDRIKDAEVETAWCGDVVGLERALGRRGVTVERRIATPPGVTPVQVDESLPSMVRRATRVGEAPARARQVP